MTSEIKVNTIKKASGSTLTLGESGTTVTIACGATTSGMGRSGTVDWCSTIYTNSPGTVTGVSGKGYFLNSTSGAITINLPSSPSVGDIISIKDYANTFDSNNITVGRGGSKIFGECIDATLNTEGQVITLIYADSTKGWINVQTDTTIVGSNFITATGGTITTSGDYKIHTFTSDGNFVVSSAGPSGVGNKTSYLVVAGGAGGGVWGGGGGGAGGFREGKCSSDPYADSPLDSGTALSVTAGTYPITVGGGGSGASSYPDVGSITNGSNSVYSTITSAGGGRGGSTNDGGPGGGFAGGSGGGGQSSDGNAGGAGNTPPVSPAQGQPGGAGGNTAPSGFYFGGGGGGATEAGKAAKTVPSPGTNDGGPGGDGAQTSINGSATYYAGGGAGGNVTSGASTGGQGGGGTASPQGTTPTAGTANTGGGGAGAWASSPTGTSSTASAGGGSGIVIIRYKFQ